MALAAFKQIKAGEHDMSIYDKPTPVRLSNAAAQAIYDKIVEQDAIIANAKNEIELANASVAFNVQNARDAYEKRQAFAAELGPLAADDFAPNTPVSPMAPPAPPSLRFHALPPFPSSRVYGGGKARGRQQETDNEF